MKINNGCPSESSNTKNFGALKNHSYISQQSAEIYLFNDWSTNFCDHVFQFPYLGMIFFGAI